MWLRAPDCGNVVYFPKDDGTFELREDAAATYGTLIVEVPPDHEEPLIVADHKELGTSSRYNQPATGTVKRARPSVCEEDHSDSDTNSDEHSGDGEVIRALKSIQLNTRQMYGHLDTQLSSLIDSLKAARH